MPRPSTMIAGGVLFLFAAVMPFVNMLRHQVWLLAALWLATVALIALLLWKRRFAPAALVLVLVVAILLQVPPG